MSAMVELTAKRLLSRKDVALLLEVSVDQVRRNEKRWGLRMARRDLNSRFVRYRAREALEALRLFIGEKSL